jgi:hypothetical protein
VEEPAPAAAETSTAPPARIKQQNRMGILSGARRDALIVLGRLI